jgi:hypothetical protein
MAHARSAAKVTFTLTETSGRSTGGFVGETAGITAVALATLEGVADGTGTRSTIISRSRTIVREAASITTGAFTYKNIESSHVTTISLFSSSHSSKRKSKRKKKNLPR